MTGKFTPIDIVQHAFPYSIRGYRPSEVRAFLEMVSHHMTSVLESMATLKNELEATKQILADHQSREADLRNAMLTAQRAIDDVRGIAQKEAQVVMGQAEVEADKILHGAHVMATHVRSDVASLKAQRLRLVEEIRGIVNTHQRLLDAMDDAISEAPEEAQIMFLDAVRAPAPPR